MSEYTEKNEARKAQQGTAGSADRRRWAKARGARRLLPDGAFGLLRHSAKTREEWLAYAQFTRAAE